MMEQLGNDLIHVVVVIGMVVISLVLLVVLLAILNRRLLLTGPEMVEVEVEEAAESLLAWVIQKSANENTVIPLREFFDFGGKFFPRDKVAVLNKLMSHHDGAPIQTSSTPRNFLQALYDYGFALPPNRVALTTTGWDIKRARILSAYQTPTNYYEGDHVVTEGDTVKHKTENNFQSGAQQFNMKGRAKVKLGKITIDLRKIELVPDSLVRDKLLAALAEDSDELSPQQRESLKKLVADVRNELGPAPASKAKLGASVEKVIGWVKTLGTGMQATNEVLAQISDLTNH